MRLHLEKLPARSDFVDTVYRVLADAITDGTLTPGERLTQEEIAEQLHVSRSPVLQALRLLKKDGLIEDAPGRGVRVTEMTPDWVADLYDVRGALDALAVRLAAARRSLIDPALVVRGRQSAAGDDLKALIDADMAFHHAIYAAAGNPLIQDSANRYWVHLRRVMGSVHRASSRRSAIWDEHQAIADAIAQGDAERAVLLSDLHIRRAKENVIQRLGELLAQPEPDGPRPHEASAPVRA